MGRAKELVLFGLDGIVSGTLNTFGAVRHRNSGEFVEGVATMAGGGLGIALGLTAGAIKLGAKAIQAGIKASQEEQQ